MFETISAIREQLRNFIENEAISAGFNVRIDFPWSVRHPAMNQNGDFEKGTFDGNTWEIRLFQKETVCLLLQFMVRGNGETDPQAITIHGYPFSCIKLFIYDTDTLPARCNATRLEIRNKLNAALPVGDNAPFAVADRNNNERKWGKHIGHIYDIYIRNPRQKWDIPHQKKQMTKAMLDAVLPAEKHLLEVAKYYCDNKEELF